ncbi:MAG: acyl-CoA dehydrogenase family protein [Aliishimia sp.]
MKPFANDEIREIMRDIADNQLRPQAAEIDQTEDYPFHHAQALAAAGINGMTIPSSFGGRGQGFEGVCIAVEEAAKACGISGRMVVDTNMGAVPAIMTYGTES